jgi:hypothetical protein
MIGLAGARNSFAMSKRKSEREKQKEKNITFKELEKRRRTYSECDVCRALQATSD